MMKSFRKQRIKLVKGFREGEQSNQQSLLDISEFENINQVFEKKKQSFNIAKFNVTLKPYVAAVQQEYHSDMTPKQKLEDYKKNKIKERKNNLFSNVSIETFRKMFQLRRSKIPKMLEGLNQAMKKQTQEKFEMEIKKSQEKLRFFRSHGKDKKEPIKLNLNNRNESLHRSKFYSLKTGKPEMNQNLFPTFEQYVEGKNRIKMQQKYHFNISKIEKGLSTFYTQQTNEQQNPQQLGQNKKGPQQFNLTGRVLKLVSRIQQGSQQQPRIKSERAGESRTQHLKSRFGSSSNIDLYSQEYIERSEQSSKKVIKTMSGFYKSKYKKKIQYNNMIEYYEHDRPLTNEIRRKKYDFLTKNDKIYPIDHYRNQSEQRRQQILALNSRTYKQMLFLLSKYHEEDIPVSLQILKQVRELMRTEYLFSADEVKRVLREVKNKFNSIFWQKKNNQDEDGIQDLMIQPLVDLLNKAFGFKIQWIIV